MQFSRQRGLSRAAPAAPETHNSPPLLDDAELFVRMDDSNTRHVNKGKGRAHTQDEEPSENTPLLASVSGSLTSSRDGSVEHPNATRRRLYSRLLSVFLISLSICVLLFALLAVVAYTWRSRASTTRPEEIIEHALVVRGPDRVEVLNATSEDGVWLMRHGRMGLDAGSVVSVKTGEDDGVLLDWWKGVGRWGIRQMDRVTVTTSEMRVGPRSNPDIVLATVSTPPIEVPLTADPPQKDWSWLTPVQIPVRIRPTRDVEDLMHFVKESWKQGFLSLQAMVGEAVVRGGGLEDHGWRSQLTISHSNIRPVINVKSASTFFLCLSVCLSVCLYAVFDTILQFLRYLAFLAQEAATSCLAFLTSSTFNPSTSFLGTEPLKSLRTPQHSTPSL